MPDEVSSAGPVGGGPPAPARGPNAITRRLLRRFVGIESKLADLKPSFWKTTIADSLKIGLTAAAMLWTAYLTGKLNQENARVGAVANAEAAERMKDCREARRDWADAKSTFQNYFINAEKFSQVPASQDFMKADVRLVRQIDIALIPSSLTKKLDEFRVAAGDGRTQCADTKKTPEERKAAAKATLLLLEQKTIEINAAFDECLLQPTRPK